MHAALYTAVGREEGSPVTRGPWRQSLGITTVWNMHSVDTKISGVACAAEMHV